MMKYTNTKAPIRKILSPLKDFFSDSRAGGILLITCTAVSLIISNTASLQEGYTHFWHQPLHYGAIHLPESPLDWVNDVLMALFFFLVGMEIKRELLIGELSSVKKSMLPILAALGGMIVPALLFWFFNGGTPYYNGWGIPMATDIAFSLAILTLLGNKVPVQIKIFLAALAIIDDLGAVLTIAIFYSSSISVLFLAGAALCVGAVLLLNRWAPGATLLYLIVSALLWLCVFNSGIHATIAGVAMAFSMPLNKLAKLEGKLHQPVNFVIMPLFALANTAIVLPPSFAGIYSSRVALGIMAGLILGKPLGIFLFSYVATRLGIASLPSNASFRQVVGVGMLGGIGFTMSIFTSSLAYDAPELLVISKVAVITASLFSSIFGYLYLSNLTVPPALRAATLAPEDKEHGLPEQPFTAAS